MNRTVRLIVTGSATGAIAGAAVGFTVVGISLGVEHVWSNLDDQQKKRVFDGVVDRLIPVVVNKSTSKV